MSRWFIASKLEENNIDTNYMWPILANVLLGIGGILLGYTFSDFTQYNALLIPAAVIMAWGVGLDVHAYQKSSKALRTAVEDLDDLLREFEDAEKSTFGFRGTPLDSRISLVDRIEKLERKFDTLNYDFRIAQQRSGGRF